MSVGERTAWDGHASMSGVDTETDPSGLRMDFAVDSVNRTYRGGKNSTRPPIHAKELTFDTDENKEAFEQGNVQGVFGYEKYYDGTASHIIVACADKVLKGKVVGDQIQFSRLWDIGTPALTHAWFVQAEDRLYYQNGVDDPRGWGGVADTGYTIEGGLALDKMPIGTAMAYIHGRLAVSTEDNAILVSDYIYGNTVVDTAGLESFIEVQQFNDLGAIIAPTYLGDIRGLIPVPQINDRDAQGNLLVLCDKGAYTLALNGLREEWLTGDIQRIVLMGQGGASDKALVPANNDVWFRTYDGGISAYKYERSEQQRSWGDTNMSREVRRYLNYDAEQRLEFTSGIVAHNRLLMSVAHTEDAHDQDGYGNHHYGRGVVVLDFDRGSTVNQRPGFAWDGLWTGVNPVQLFTINVDNATRPMCVSRDDDGINRIYEFMPDGTEGPDKGPETTKEIVSFYKTSRMFRQADPKQSMIVTKRLSGVRVEASEIADPVNIKVSYAPDYYPCFTEAAEQTVGAQLTEQTGFIDQQNRHDSFYLPVDQTPGCQLGSKRILNRGFMFTGLVELEGNVVINMLQFQCEVQPEDMRPTCSMEALQKERDRYQAEAINCSLINFFTYKIVTAE